MTKTQLIELSVQLHDDMLANLNAYQITGDNEFLQTAQSLQNELTLTEIEITYHN